MLLRMSDISRQGLRAILIVIDVLGWAPAQQGVDDICRSFIELVVYLLGCKCLVELSLASTYTGQVFIHNLIDTAMSQQPILDALVCRLQPLHCLNFAPALHSLCQLKNKLIPLFQSIQYGYYRI
ncbi:hypothetical protein D1872_207840 [compost metagenome]